jgi:hypothetical protein
MACFPPEPAGLDRCVCFRTRRDAGSERGFGVWKRTHGEQKRAIVEREREFVKRERGILKREREFVERERDILKRERGLGERERGFFKRERGLALSISAQEPRTTPHEPPLKACNRRFPSEKLPGVQSLEQAPRQQAKLAPVRKARTWPDECHLSHNAKSESNLFRPPLREEFSPQSSTEEHRVETECSKIILVPRFCLTAQRATTVREWSLALVLSNRSLTVAARTILIHKSEPGA